MLRSGISWVRGVYGRAVLACVALALLAPGVRSAPGDDNLLKPAGELSAWQTDPDRGVAPDYLCIDGCLLVTGVSTGAARGSVFQVVTGLVAGSMYTLRMEARASTACKIDVAVGAAGKPWRTWRDVSLGTAPQTVEFTFRAMPGGEVQVPEITPSPDARITLSSVALIPGGVLTKAPIARYSPLQSGNIAPQIASCQSSGSIDLAELVGKSRQAVEAAFGAPVRTIPSDGPFIGLLGDTTYVYRPSVPHLSQLYVGYPAGRATFALFCEKRTLPEPVVKWTRKVLAAVGFDVPSSFAIPEEDGKSLATTVVVKPLESRFAVTINTTINNEDIVTVQPAISATGTGVAQKTSGSQLPVTCRGGDLEFRWLRSITFADTVKMEGMPEMTPSKAGNKWAKCMLAVNSAAGDAVRWMPISGNEGPTLADASGTKFEIRAGSMGVESLRPDVSVFRPSPALMVLYFEVPGSATAADLRVLNVSVATTGPEPGFARGVVQAVTIPALFDEAGFATMPLLTADDVLQIRRLVKRDVDLFSAMQNPGEQDKASLDCLRQLAAMSDNDLASAYPSNRLLQARATWLAQRRTLLELTGWRAEKQPSVPLRIVECLAREVLIMDGDERRKAAVLSGSSPDLWDDFLQKLPATRRFWNNLYESGGMR